MKPQAILLKYNLHPIKKWGQNFLNNEQIVNQITNSFGCENTDGILEIGPGLGIMTASLLKKAQKVVSIEIDKKLIPILNEHFKNETNFKLINDDFLNVNLSLLIKEHFVNIKRIHIVANLPYYLTSPILFKLLDNVQYFTSFTLMMQKEVAQRITSLPNNKAYSNLSVICQYYSKVSILLKISRHNFFPEPNVDSWIVHFALQKNYQVDNEREFNDFVRKLFAMKRKTLLNNLNLITNNKQISESLILKLNLPLTIRSEQLTIEQFINLYHFVKDNGNIILIRRSFNDK
ncbi:16S rRNA (adenine(1518)-N(6)/adenine(1519)-N(6))-dimethyltransferase RsmA [Spiroplasma endosymbiont of Asaphidion curtum]|uniref:16S rRNA (adenine(1518)-N(6)/adenine(1519)-N(6))- dimethyltransferase RsmA n=1 Tax=Spiroplasma endosymbiont of Asaphidion curtum TaxID=3066281 RepID=UPI00313E345C